MTHQSGLKAFDTQRGRKITFLLPLPLSKQKLKICPASFISSQVLFKRFKLQISTLSGKKPVR